MTHTTCSQNISFYRSESVDTSASLSLSLDDEKNQSVYGEAKTSFMAGEAAYLKLLGVSDHLKVHSKTSYELGCSTGTVSKSAVNIAYPCDEDVTFRLSISEQLQQVPYGHVNWQWIGKDGGTPLFMGRTITIPAPKIGVLKCEYKSLGDRLKLIVTQADMGNLNSMDVLVVVYKDGNVLASTTVTYENDVVLPVPVELSVADFCSDEEIENVEVFIDGSFIGRTNNEGKIALGNLIPGQKYQLKMLREGYTDSDLDVLHNDEFTVPEG